MNTKVLSIKVYKEYWHLNDTLSDYYLFEPVGWESYSCRKILDVVCISEFIFKQMVQEHQDDQSKLARAVWDYGEVMREIRRNWERREIEEKRMQSYHKLVEDIINKGGSGT